MTNYTLFLGQCEEVLRGLPDNSVDSTVTDPPYGLRFMGKKWDYDVPDTCVWSECLRVLKPGGHLLAFAGPRTQHRMAVRIEDAGFEIRDMIAWVYGSGFPKSLDVSKAIDRVAGVERKVMGVAGRSGSTRNCMAGDFTGGEYLATAPATDAARQWQGWGTALKPALEPITVARKPLIGTVAENVLAHGTGAINVDGCRVATDDGADRSRPPRTPNAIFGGGKGTNLIASEHNNAGRWPANLIHDGSEEVVGLFPESKSRQMIGKRSGKEEGILGSFAGQSEVVMGHNDLGSAARFFYCAKASKRDRDEGCEGLEAKTAQGMRSNADPALVGEDRNRTQARNIHPTVKPTDLMRYLVRLVTPPGGVVLDPFMGSGSTGKAARLEGFKFIGIEKDQTYFDIAKSRVSEEG